MRGFHDELATDLLASDCSVPATRHGDISATSSLFDGSEVTHVHLESQSWRVEGCASVVRRRDRQNHAFAP